MNIYFFDGRHFKLNILDIETDIISNKECIMRPSLIKYIQKKYNNKYYYSFFIKDKDIELEYYIPSNTLNIFALESLNNPYLLHNIVKFKSKNHITFKLLKYIREDVNIYNKNGYTPLYIACIHENIDIIEQLVINGAQYNVKCCGYLSPVEFCNNTKAINSTHKAMFDLFCLIDNKLY